MRTTKHFITYMYPGLIMGESENKAIDSRPALADVELPRGAFAFRFFDKVYVGATDDEGNKFERLVEGCANESKTFYPGGETFTLEQVKKWEGDFKILISNMEGNDYPVVVKTRCGNIQPFDSEKQELL